MQYVYVAQRAPTAKQLKRLLQCLKSFEPFFKKKKNNNSSFSKLEKIINKQQHPGEQKIRVVRLWSLPGTLYQLAPFVIPWGKYSLRILISLHGLPWNIWEFSWKRKKECLLLFVCIDIKKKCWIDTGKNFQRLPEGVWSGRARPYSLRHPTVYDSMSVEFSLCALTFFFF